MTLFTADQRLLADVLPGDVAQHNHDALHVTALCARRRNTDRDFPVFPALGNKLSRFRQTEQIARRDHFMDRKRRVFACCYIPDVKDVLTVLSGYILLLPAHQVLCCGIKAFNPPLFVGDDHRILGAHGD
jgi:hypothetical protein